jgi:hypothetical protein
VLTPEEIQARLAEVRATILVQRSIVSSGVTQVAERDRNMKTDVKFVAEQLRDNEELERRLLALLGECSAPPMVRHIRTYSTRGY